MADARLLVTDRQGRRTVPLDQPVCIIGRGSAAHVRIPHADVSRAHAEITRQGERYVLRDTSSRNSTLVNGAAVTEHVLLHKDVIRVGGSADVELVFLLGDEASGLRSGSAAGADLRQMAAILNGLRALGSGRVLEDVLTLVLDGALDVTRADRAFVMLADARGGLQFKAARGRGGKILPGSSFATSERIPHEVFTTGRTQIVTDLIDVSPGDAHDATLAMGIRHVICVALRTPSLGSPDREGESEVFGVLYLDGRERGVMLSTATLNALEGFATQAALAIESARLYAESAEKARLDRDLRVAADIQRALLPEATHERATFDLAAVAIPCRTVGGDFFDYLDTSDVDFGFALGDVAGKGPPAALLAAAVQSNFVAQAPVSRDPADAMARLNRALLRRAIEGRFATMWYGVLSPHGTFHHCNAGQEPPLLIGRHGIRWLEEGGPVLGLLGGASYTAETIQLAPGDLVIVYSDGITEARNRADEEFGRSRLLEAVDRAHGEPPKAVLDRLIAEVQTFAEGAPQADDLTALVLRYRGDSQSDS